MKASSVFGSLLLRVVVVVVVTSLLIFSNDCTGFPPPPPPPTTTGSSVLPRIHHRDSPLLLSSTQEGVSVHQQRAFAVAAFKGTAKTTTTTTTVSPTRLFSSTGDHATQTPSSSKAELDVDAIVKYGGALVIQLGLISGIFTGLDWLVSRFNIQVPFAVNCLLFYFLALKSRIFNPLANTRPKPSTLEIEAAADDENNKATTKRPSWTPPGFIFPIMWLLIIGPIRAATSAMVYASTGSYTCLPILSLMLHLSIGDVWNTINNVERRYGVSVIGVFLVWLSKAHAAYQYLQVGSGLPGKILAVTLVWLTIASALITRTWQQNPDAATGKVEPLYPVKGKVKTRYIWFQQ
jgi:translocator protein